MNTPDGREAPQVLRSRKVNGVRVRILLAVAATCATLLLFTAGAVLAQLNAVEQGAHVEALNLGRAIAYGAAIDPGDPQQYLQGLDTLYKRDLVIVDRQRRGLADANPDEIGHFYDQDPNNEVSQTLADGLPRTFVEHGALHPTGLSQLVVPVYVNGLPEGGISGAVILEISGIQEELLAATRNTRRAIGAAGAFCVLLVAVMGMRHARTITSAAHNIEFVAYHDRLTGLPNRSMFTQVLSQGMKEATRYGRRLAVFFIDLDRFKNINDTLGHEAGDRLLQEVAVRLQSCLRASDTVARLGGDEFVVVLPNANDTEQLSGVAHKILVTLAQPVMLAGKEFRVTASIGISAFPDDGEDERALMKHADIAMYQAKEEGKNSYAFYSEAMNRHSLERLAFESSLRHAVDEAQFELHYQPKVDCLTGRMTGFEALLRWQHKDLGSVPPSKFIPVAEETGLIVPLGRWVLRTACEQHVAWRRQGLPPLPMAVNLSARQFADEHLYRDVCAVLTDTGMDPHCLELEITESMLMHDVEKARQVLAQFHALGIRLSVDDFGTGYSSLSNLKQFPIDTIKVDRSFIRDIIANREDKAIADAIIAVGKTLCMTVVAEGVETEAQADLLRARGCNELQGYYFSKAVTAQEIVALLGREELLAPAKVPKLAEALPAPAQLGQSADMPG